MLSLAEHRVARDLDDVKHSMFIQGKNEMTRQALQDKHDTITLDKDLQNLKAVAKLDHSWGRTEVQLLRDFGENFRCSHPFNIFNINFGIDSSIRLVVFQSHLEREVFAYNAEVLMVDATHCVNNVGYNCFGIMAVDCFGHGQMV